MSKLTRRVVCSGPIALAGALVLAGGTTIYRKDGSDLSPNLVRAVQRALTERGYDPGPDDGIMGPRTMDAIYAFRIAKGLDGSVEIDEALLIALGLAEPPAEPEVPDEETGAAEDPGT